MIPESHVASFHDASLSKTCSVSPFNALNLLCFTTKRHFDVIRPNYVLEFDLKGKQCRVIAMVIMHVAVLLNHETHKNILKTFNLKFHIIQQVYR